MDYTISLYYIEGINSTDTPFFSNKGEQSTYFSNHLVANIASSYYPPYYRNRIRLSSDDITFGTNINYLALEGTDRIYYYFIQRQVYITDGVIELEVLMDVIQTYTFDIKVNYCTIERMFIDRYTNDSINRNYIRENVSCNSFSKITNYNVLNEDKSKWMVFGKYSEYPLSSSTLNKYVQNYSLINDAKVELYRVPEFISYTPFYTGNITKSGDTYSIGSSDLLATVDNAYQTDAYIIPFPCLEKFSISNGTITDANAKVINLNEKSGYTNYLLYNDSVLQTSALYYTYAFGFAKNTKVGELFNSKYVPCLLDDNYIRFEFGDNEVITKFPLYYLTTNILYCLYWADIGTGYRYYMLNDSINIGTNKYQSIVSNSNVPSFTLRNDAWKSYISRNKATLANAIINDSMNIVSNVANASAKDMMYEQRINDILDEPKSYTPKRHQLKKKYQIAVDNLEAQQDANYTSSIINSIGSTNQLGNYITNEINLKYTPAVITRNGMINTSLLGSSLYISYHMYYADDFENCAQYYHKNGYLVNRYFSSIDNIFTLVKSRYYFNVIKCSDIDIHLSNCIETQELIDLLTIRFTNGLRLWNVNRVDIGNFLLDNVEEEYIKEA